MNDKLIDKYLTERTTTIEIDNSEYSPETVMILKKNKIKFKQTGDVFEIPDKQMDKVRKVLNWSDIYFREL